MKSKRTPLSDEEKEKILTLHAGGKSINAIGKATHRHHRTLERFLSRPGSVKQLAERKELFASAFDDLQGRALLKNSDEKLEKSSSLQLATIAAICADKSALLRGEMPQTIDVSALLEVVVALKHHEERERDSAWAEAHTRIVLDASKCRVQNCPVHSPRLLPPAPDTN